MRNIKMATDETVAPEKSAARELLALLLSRQLPRAPLPRLDEIKQILEISQKQKSAGGVM
jgi:hypothetical protein